MSDLQVGHAGTLDPGATGLVIVCTGRGTKNVDAFVQQEKDYHGGLFVQPGENPVFLYARYA